MLSQMCATKISKAKEKWAMKKEKALADLEIEQKKAKKREKVYEKRNHKKSFGLNDHYR